jgi:CBS domain-containing protein
MAMIVKDIMTQNVISVQPEESITHAIRLMLQHGISGLAVVDKAGDLVGLVTEGDFMRRVETGTQKQRSRFLQFLIGPGRLADEYVHLSGRRISEVMSSPVHTVTEEALLSDAVDLMERHRIKRLPVVRGRKVVGVVSRANFLHALASMAHDVKPPLKDDAAIRGQILAELSAQKWTMPNLINVVVRDGNVDLWGTITDERTRAALIVAAENVSGVKAVRDHMVWVEPISGMVIGPAGETDVRAP